LRVRFLLPKANSHFVLFEVIEPPIAIHPISPSMHRRFVVFGAAVDMKTHPMSRPLKEKDKDGDRPKK